jgi:uncharacterized protein (TIGR02246 family)
MIRSGIAASLIVNLLLSNATFAAERGSAGRFDCNVTGTATDTVEIQQVMEAYHHAVVTHDGSRLAALFIPEGATWLKVLSQSAYARAAAGSAAALKVRPGSFQEFAKFVSGSKQSLDPKHSNVRIQSDGAIAAVYFDFVFLIDGKEENRGSESWQLVKGDDGWRIASITYSANPREP